ncbi:MAG TPA: hypothetical protein VJV96_17130 [Candidatus Angelobacter sp.]|nr:hypothetical protein [Candidatus Angelobacter sp.]
MTDASGYHFGARTRLSADILVMHRSIMRRFVAAITLLLQMAICAFPQSAIPGEIRLLPGYQHRALQGIDSRVGEIWKIGGLRIRYDIGAMAGDYTECKSCGWTKGELWRKEQIVNGQKMICVFTASKQLVISFPASHANFYATVTTPEQEADMLLMLFTFRGMSQ